uniref:DUF4281 domain-containing protein n=1 Tax=Trieres chinensis TaxID=1514140 RepID=A0A7S2ELT1_TRICV|mmetsp:Transcript_29627/g.60494  ORF Transcript_29627/g.60494 Transcript_29627/m.60494 type:complete len:167 (+) Transcript_29627:101-601(+)|eukprot:CAMPEP_0183292392 /NCGR_PEP_ID=MMETSP0160_2-20130417/1463_1 /TAXON_ID=2839 ORGANISM="Odontella Sinensis, Strain Grunow 1884" /NCGR_SAMPLE_ID=MMETSP0160_2 /ASSEMBLY_ACC=CAM_ASM_000250 /LENGTH=166 /DNA_ID=CAMNT_0025453335 /DNA_START=78 /DNA_END=578 /DNA_ORIENTATION=-
MTLEGLRPLALLGGLNAADLWPTINLCLVSWLLFVFAPRWKHTPTVSLIAPLFHAALYSLSATSMMFFGDDANASEIDFGSLEGIVTLFKDPNGVFVGWVHYVVYDALVGRWITMDSVERGAGTALHALVIVPVLFLALMFGPSGWLLYMAVVRPFLLPVAKAKSS